MARRAERHTAGTEAGAAPEAGDPRRGASRAQVWLALAIVYVVWGSTYLASAWPSRRCRRCSRAALRFLLAGAVCGWRSRVRRGAPPLAAGLALGAAVGGARRLAARRPAATGSSMVAEEDVVVAPRRAGDLAVPLWVVLFRRITGERVAARDDRERRSSGSPASGCCFAAGGGGNDGSARGLLPRSASRRSSWALGTFLSRGGLPRDPFTVDRRPDDGRRIRRLLIGLVAGEAGESHSSDVSGDSLLAFGYLVVFGSLVAYTAYVWLLQNAPISQRGDVRVRESRHRDLPRLADPRRAHRAARRCSARLPSSWRPWL